jgi:glutathione S-transferase
MSLVFYYSPMSSAVTVHWALEELGVPYEKVRVDLQAGDQKKPAFLAINPNGKVPALVHDGVKLFESVAILIHLGETYGVEKKLFPAPGLARAEALKWLVWCNVSLGEALSRWHHSGSPRVPAEIHNEKALAKAKADVEALVDILEKELAGKKFLVGDSFTLADLQVSGWFDYLGMLGFDKKKWPNTNAWTERCSSRPAHARAMSEG